MLKRFSWKAILIGVLIDTIGSFLSGIGLLLVCVLAASRTGSPGLRLNDAVHSEPLLQISLLMGLLLVALSGFVTARLAKSAPVLNTAAMAIVICFVSIPFSLSLPLWYNLVSFSMILPCALLGALPVVRRQ